MGLSSRLQRSERKWPVYGRLEANKTASLEEQWLVDKSRFSPN